ncbi:MAG: GNAT family N-acetyltransferase [Parachlamydiales bacterium]|nr:GNAT family N-acetyltransferase [Verrucomicrobiota bacterium]MBX3718776.1 GNAT family N-acetyltransferase [Candidatus Acheromyda pituitae]
MTQPELSIRLTRLEDAPPLMQWLMDPKILSWFPMIDAREVEDAVRIWIGYSRIEAALTAEWNGEPCGMANLYIQPYKKLMHTCLFSIIVKENMRGKGIGSALLKQLMKHAKEKFKIEILHLEVYDGNPARRLYERHGFKPFGKQVHFIKENGKYLGKTMMQMQL